MNVMRVYQRSFASFEGDSTMTSATRPLAIVTGASSGIGYELAKCCAEQGFDLLIAADQPTIYQAAQEFRAPGGGRRGRPCHAGRRRTLYAAAKGRPVEALLANAAGTAWGTPSSTRISRPCGT